MANWPHELKAVVENAADRLGVESLYFEDEITGLGGARTFRARTDLAEGIGQRVVLKIGEANQIDDERRRYNQATLHFGTHPALHDSDGTVDCFSWMAMSVALDGLGHTLRQRFDHLSETEIDTVLDQLFTRGIRLYERTGFNRARSAFSQYALNSSLIPKLREIGDRPYTLADWWKHAEANDVQHSTEAYIHGDLHGGNVLLAGIETSITVSLIDFGLSGTGHAYRDLAKLERDLCLFVDGARDDTISARLEEIDSQLKSAHPTGTSNDPSIARAVRAIRQIRKLAEGFSRAGDGDRWQHEYDVALMAQLIFSAGNRSISDAKRRGALARAYTLRDALIMRSPVLEPEPASIRARDLEDQAWQFAYSLLRLDQLPRGGWSRSLPLWMEVLWEGEHGTVFRSPSMKDDGGADSAGYAVHLLSRFFSRVYFDDLADFVGIQSAVQACAMGLQKRLGPHGGLDEGATSRGEPPPMKVRHTIVGLLAHLNCKRVGAPGFVTEDADLMVTYLLKVLPKWKEDKSHLFGMYASAVALRQILGESVAATLSQSSTLASCLEDYLPDMAMPLQDVMYTPSPEGTYPTGASLVDGKIHASFFIPYYGLWRMERSNALMFLPLLFDESGTRLSNGLPPALSRRIATHLKLLLNEIDDSSDFSEGLIRYHVSVGRTKAPRDWGLSAELVRLLELPVIEEWLLNVGVRGTTLKKKKSILHRALCETLADYGTYHAVFRCTHGLSVGAYLSEQVARRISPRQVSVLDSQVQAARDESCSEQTLHRLAQCILTGQSVGIQEDKKEASLPQAKMLTELFVKTLAAGDHAHREHWNVSSYQSTIAHFSRGTPDANPAARSGIHDTLFRRLLHVSGPFRGENLRAADLGCGSGSAAKWLMEQKEVEKIRFDVTLLDGSPEMIECAKNALKVKAARANKGRAEFVCADVHEIHRHLAVSSFDLVIANALLIHIAPRYAADVISKIYSILKPGGHFFCNLKIRDHTLLSLDGRYFAYYSDINSPRSMLRAAGFEIDEVALRQNDKTCFGVPKDIHWANFYCRKPDRPDPH